MLNAQTNKNFDLFVYHTGPGIEKVKSDSVVISKDINHAVLFTPVNEGCWRRHELARDLAQQGYKKIMFLDDDVIFPDNYVELVLSNYEEFSYKSWWAWDLKGAYHYEKDRVRVLDTETPVNYCGAGVSIIDARIFLKDEYFNVPIDDAKWIDDVWLSFYSRHVLGWKLQYLDIAGISFDESAADSAALYIKIMNGTSGTMSKKDFTNFLKQKYGWNPDR